MKKETNKKRVKLDGMEDSGSGSSWSFSWSKLFISRFEFLFVLMAFLLSTTYFIIERSSGVSWDLYSHISIAKFWFADGSMIESMRTPVTSLLMGVFSVFGWDLSPYIFIIFVSVLFAFSVVLYARQLGMNAALLYILLLSPFAMNYGLSNGTELLSMVFVILFCYFLLRENWLSGVFFGLAFLTRYNYVFFGLLLWFHRPKVLWKSVVAFFATLMPWFIYSYFQWGSAIASIADAYNLNVVLRRLYMEPTYTLLALLKPATVILPFFLYGIYIAVCGIRQGQKKQIIESMLMLGLMCLTIFQYFRGVVGEDRYLYPLILPYAYFGAIAIHRILKDADTRTKYFVVAVLLIASSAITWNMFLPKEFDTKDKYIEAKRVLEESGIDGCRLRTNGWTIVNAFDQAAEPYAREELLRASIDSGEKHLLFFIHGEPLYIYNESFLAKYPVMYRSRNFIILGKKGICAKPVKYDRPLYEYMNEQVMQIFGVGIETRPCMILFGENFVTRALCR